MAPPQSRNQNANWLRASGCASASDPLGGSQDERRCRGGPPPPPRREPSRLGLGDKGAAAPCPHLSGAPAKQDECPVARRWAEPHRAGQWSLRVDPPRPGRRWAEDVGGGRRLALSSALRTHPMRAPAGPIRTRSPRAATSAPPSGSAGRSPEPPRDLGPQRQRAAWGGLGAGRPQRQVGEQVRGQWRRRALIGDICTRARPLCGPETRSPPLAAGPDVTGAANSGRAAAGWVIRLVAGPRGPLQPRGRVEIANQTEFLK